MKDLARWEGILRGRVTLVDSRGAVLADTESDPSTMDNHLSRPEVKEALSVGEGTALRYSTTTNMHYLYFARKISLDGERTAVIRSPPPGASFGGLRRDPEQVPPLSPRCRGADRSLRGRAGPPLFRPLDRVVESAGKIARERKSASPHGRTGTGVFPAPLTECPPSSGEPWEELRSGREDLSRIVAAPSRGRCPARRRQKGPLYERCRRPAACRTGRRAPRNTGGADASLRRDVRSHSLRPGRGER